MLDHVDAEQVPLGVGHVVVEVDRGAGHLEVDLLPAVHPGAEPDRAVLRVERILGYVGQAEGAVTRRRHAQNSSRRQDQAVDRGNGAGGARLIHAEMWAQGKRTVIPDLFEEDMVLRAGSLSNGDNSCPVRKAAVTLCHGYLSAIKIRVAVTVIVGSYCCHRDVRTAAAVTVTL